MTTNLRPVTAASLADQAYAGIKQLIFDFTLMPGDRFSESELAQRVQVSRTPLRQALQRLEREGFLLVFPKLGWQVTPLDFDQFDELYDLRVLIECHAAQALAQADPRPALDDLAAVWLVPPAQRRTAADEVRAFDEQFHGALVRAAGNREMARVHREITDRIRIIRGSTSPSPPAWMRRTTSMPASCAPSRAAAPTRRSACCVPTSSRASWRCGTSRWTCCTARAGRRDGHARRPPRSPR